ncbi:MAG: hypothetical protein A2W86_13035 [Bacteroidetes bacterium GWD2_45_23]|nr:MAG: hypothetical protein A2W87_06665 [Bacteroidetes bacterium GWC2_46_850]OFX84562.1 MAG: hypothetical protein A2W86_13035 [Bacteroidetes bacterium GWD2_45_23]HBB00214.1 hypothetical protein [Porphyromonadaceae bacterium]HCC18111.1 hypothetical protein [Porphyromonadaceae bacterium]
MQKILFILAFSTSIILQTNAQDIFKAPDFAQIERNTKESVSSYYYPNLIKKYQDGTQMTPEEGRHLYFGYIYQPGYVPTDTSEFNSKLAAILSKQSFVQEDYKNIVQYADALLLEDPFNLRALNAKLLVYAQENNTEEYKKVALKRRIVQDAIIGTGDGMSEKTPFYVIKVAHEYDILPFLGYNFGGEDKILKGNKVNYLSLGENRFGVERVYFNISPIIDHLSVRGGGKM